MPRFIGLILLGILIVTLVFGILSFFLLRSLQDHAQRNVIWFGMISTKSTGA